MPERQLELLASNASHLLDWMPRIIRNRPTELELRIALVSEDTLILQSHEFLPMTIFGWPVGFGAGIIGTIIALTMLIFLYRQSQPLRELARAVDKVDFRTHPEPIAEVRSAAPEIRSLTRAFNRQQQRLSQIMRSRKVLVGGLQHDIRTFATKLRLRLESARETAMAERAVADLDDIVRLLDDALLATQGTASSTEPTLELVEMHELILAETEVRNHATMIVDDLIEQTNSPPYVLGDRLALRRIFINLIENALIYGNQAEIQIIFTRSTITVYVDDDGPGIPIDIREQVLEPFVRLDHSRARATGGSGLGMAIVANLVAQHNGKFEISEAQLGGARMIVELPRFRTDKAEI